MSKVIQEAVALTKRPIKIIYAKSVESELLPAGGIDLNELISTKGNLEFYLWRVFNTTNLFRNRYEQFEKVG